MHQLVQELPASSIRDLYLRQHPLSVAISKLNCLAGRMAFFHHSTFVIAWANINYLIYLLYTYSCIQF